MQKIREIRRPWHSSCRRARFSQWVSALSVVVLMTSCADTKAELRKFAPWQPGFLDIHHISTGRGDAAFFVFPDGTTMLFDAGDLDLRAMEKYPPLRVTDAKPNSDDNSGFHIAEYIRRAMPEFRTPQIDYAVISHFHSDHFGHFDEDNRLSARGSYRVSGISEVAEHLSIGTLIDRAYPEYNFPVDLRKYYDNFKPDAFNNYLRFVESNVTQGLLKVEKLSAGRDDQIVLANGGDFPEFSVRNVKANGQIWSGSGRTVNEHFTAADVLSEKRRFSENPLSLALEVAYGSFDYYTGGDNTGLRGFGNPEWFDVETPMGEALGQVDVLIPNHHGHRDGTNENFLAALAPRVIVQQSWDSDHPGGEVLHRMISPHIWKGDRDIFSTSMAEETKVAIGPWLVNAYSSFEGHIVIRVSPGGEKFNVFVLDDRSVELEVLSEHGPYDSN